MQAGLKKGTYTKAGHRVSIILVRSSSVVSPLGQLHHVLLCDSEGERRGEMGANTVAQVARGIEARTRAGNWQAILRGRVATTLRPSLARGRVITGWL